MAHLHPPARGALPPNRFVPAPAVLLAVALAAGSISGRYGRPEALPFLWAGFSLTALSALFAPTPLALSGAGYAAGAASACLKRALSSPPTREAGDGDRTFAGILLRTGEGPYGRAIHTVRVTRVLQNRWRRTNFVLRLSGPRDEPGRPGAEVRFRARSVRWAGRDRPYGRAVGVTDGPMVFGNAGLTGSLQRGRRRLSAAVGDLSGPGAGLLAAVALGERERLDPGCALAMRRTGTYHLLAVSGIHVAASLIPVLMARRLLFLVGGPRVRAALAASVPLAALPPAVYLYFTGLSASALRALIFVLLAAAAAWVGRWARPETCLGWCVVLIVLFGRSPAPAMSLILSAAAVAGILASLRRGRGGWAAAAARATTGAALFTLPVSVWLVRGVPLAVLPANLFAGPAAGILLVPGAVLLDLAAAAGLPVARAAAAWAFAANRFLAALVLLARVPGTFMPLPAWGCAAVTVAAVPGIGLWLRAGRGVRAGILVLAAVCAVGRGAGALEEWAAAGAWRIYFPALGRADCAVIRSGGTTILVDTGPPPRPGREARAARFIERLGTRRIEAVFLSHPHPDHVGGLRDIVRRWPVGAVYVPEATLGDESWGPVLEGLPPGMVVPLPQGAGLTVGGLVFDVLGPDASAAREGDINAGSMILTASGGPCRALFTGDAGWRQVEAVLSRVGVPDLLKVPHHGSATGLPPSRSFPGTDGGRGRRGMRAVCTSPAPGLGSLPSPRAVAFLKDRGFDLHFTGGRGVAAVMGDGGKGRACSVRMVLPTPLVNLPVDAF